MSVIAAVKSRPILFSAPMIRAILDGHKTVTRRVVKSQPAPSGDNPHAIRCPHGAPGDSLWVRETYLCAGHGARGAFVWAYRADGIDDPDESARRAAPACVYGKRAWRPSIHMFRCASRLILRIADVRAERLAEITEADAVAEGALHAIADRDGRAYDLDEAAWCRWSKRLDPGATAATARGAFAAIWERINGKRPGCDWASDPWVWRIAFDVVKPEGPRP